MMQTCDVDLTVRLSSAEPIDGAIQAGAEGVRFCRRHLTSRLGNKKTAANRETVTSHGNPLTSQRLQLACAHCHPKIEGKRRRVGSRHAVAPPERPRERAPTTLLLHALFDATETDASECAARRRVPRRL